MKPKDELIQKLYEDNSTLYYELNKQYMLIDKAPQYEKERKDIISNNKELNLKVQNTENNYSTKIKEETKRIELEYKRKVNKLEDKVSYLNKIINTLKNTIDKFISWVCHKFIFSSEDKIIKDFENETNSYIDPEKELYNEYSNDLEW